MRTRQVFTAPFSPKCCLLRTSLSTPRKKCLPAPSVASCTFASFLFFLRSKTISVSMTREQRKRAASFWSYFQADARKNPRRRCFISDRISRQNRLRHVPALDYLPRPPVLAFSQLASSHTHLLRLRSTPLFAKCLRTAAAVASRRLQTFAGTFHRDRRCRRCIFEPLLPRRWGMPLCERQLHLSAYPLGRISRVALDSRYFLRIVSRGDGWRYLAWSFDLGVDYTFYGPARSQGRPPPPDRDASPIYRNYTDTLWANKWWNDGGVMDLWRRCCL